MSEEDKKKKKKLFDKILMGAVIGGAIGSVVGASVGENNKRKNEKREKSNPPLQEKKKYGRKFFGLFKKKHQEGAIKQIPNEMEEYKK